MRLRDLIEQLQDLATEHGEDIEVRIAHQPSWPFEYSIGAVEAVSSDDDDDDEDPEDDDEEDDEEDDDDDDRSGEPPLQVREPEPPVVYIAEGSQLGYLPGIATNALGWGRGR